MRSSSSQALPSSYWQTFTSCSRLRPVLDHGGKPRSPTQFFCGVLADRGKERNLSLPSLSAQMTARRRPIPRACGKAFAGELFNLEQPSQEAWGSVPANLAPPCHQFGFAALSRGFEGPAALQARSVMAWRDQAAEWAHSLRSDLGDPRR